MPIRESPPASDAGYDPALSLATAIRPLRGLDALAARLRLVLETPAGRMPWRPEFGLDLQGIVGGPASTTRLDEARMRILAAIGNWLPEIEVVSCDVALAELERLDLRDPTVPTAERALGSQAVSAALEIRLVLQTDDGPVSFEAALTP